MHAEAVEVVYDPKQISFDELIQLFWENHNPTTLNRQGPDVGTQYRSAVFFHDSEQEDIAKRTKDELDKSDKFNQPIVTEINLLKRFTEQKNITKNIYLNEVKEVVEFNFCVEKYERLSLLLMNF